MLRVISIRRCTPAGFKLTKLFGIDDFSVAKDFGKVFIIIIYCFYNYYLCLLLLLLLQVKPVKTIFNNYSMSPRWIRGGK